MNYFHLSRTIKSLQKEKNIIVIRQDSSRLIQIFRFFRILFLRLLLSESTLAL